MFVDARNLKINIECVAYIEKADAKITVFFVGGQSPSLTIVGEDGECPVDRRK